MIAAGILLPLVIVVFFILATMIPRWLVDPPQYDFVFTSMQNPTAGPQIELTYVVEDGRIKARVYKSERSYRNIPKLFLFDHRNSSVREISVVLPADLDEIGNGAYIDVPGLESRTASTNRTAPDGYEVRGPGYRRGDMFFPFYGGRRSNSFTLYKNGAVVDVPQAGNNGAYYYNGNFVGWLTDPGDE